MVLTKNIDENIKLLEERFKECGDLVKKEMYVGKNLDIKIYVAYFDLLTDRSLFERAVVESIMVGMKESLVFLEKDDDIYNKIKKQGITTADYKEDQDLDNLYNSILSGDTLLLVEGSDNALVIATKGFPNRGIPAAENEVVLEGSKDSFSEVYRFNTVLVRRRIRDSRLKLVQKQLGKRSQVDIGIMYMEDIAHKEVVDNIIKSLDKINIDGVFDATYLNELMFNKKSIFPQAQKTERPDKACSALLEGRVILLLDNTPIVLILPTIFSVYFQSSQDYYDNYIIASTIRTLRYGAFLVSILLPAIYLCISLYNPSLISREIMYRIASTRSAVPFNPVLELLMMELAFELLKEASLRLPPRISGTLGIVGGLIIGQSTIEAGLTSPIVVIIVSITAISTFAIPNIALTNTTRVLKFLFIISSAFFGFLGLVVAGLLVLVHLASLSNFGIPYLYPFISTTNQYTQFRDIFFRYPLYKMEKRPIFANAKQKTRLRGEVNEYDK